MTEGKEVFPREVDKEIPDTPKRVYAPPFERFYQTYPRRVGKGAAYRAWTKAVQGMTNEEIDKFALECINAVKAQKKYRDTYTGSRTLPDWKHPSTWLNGACWLDELDSIAPTKSRELGECREPECQKKVMGFDYGLEDYCAYHYSMKAGRETLSGYIMNNPYLRKRKDEMVHEWHGRLRKFILARAKRIGRSEDEDA